MFHHSSCASPLRLLANVKKISPSSPLEKYNFQTRYFVLTVPHWKYEFWLVPSTFSNLLFCTTGESWCFIRNLIRYTIHVGRKKRRWERTVIFTYFFSVKDWRTGISIQFFSPLQKASMWIWGWKFKLLLYNLRNCFKLGNNYANFNSS